MSFRERDNPGKRWTQEEAVEWGKRVGEHLGRTPTHRDIAPYHMTMVRLFGSIGAWQEACGFEPRSPGRPAKS